MGLPKFAGYLLGNSDMTVKLRYDAKLGQKHIQTMNITFIGGFRNEK